MTESAARNKLYRNGYHLIKITDCYDVPKYSIADENQIMIYGDLSSFWGTFDLDEIEDWIREIID